MSFVEWSALGIFLVLLELFSPGIYLIWFGFAALAVGGIDYYEDLSLTYQLIAFSVLSAVMAYAGFYIYRLVLKHGKKPEYPHLNNLAGQHIGKTVALISDVKDGETKVKVGDSVWIAHTNENLKANDMVKITGVEPNGVVFTVESL